MNLHIRNGRVIDPKNQMDRVCDVYVVAGKIAAFDTAPDSFAGETLDASGLIVTPGLVDLAVRLREPGCEYIATLESEMAAAVAGGITRLSCPPDTDPPLDEPGLVEMLKFRARKLRQAHVYPIGALTTGLKGQELTEMAELVDAGCVGFSQANAPLTDTRVLMRAMQYAATFDFPLWLRPQDYYLAKNGVAHDGEIAARYGFTPIPVCAETIALSTILALMRETGARVHICRISSAAGVDMIRAAKREGLPLTCDVSINHVHLCDNDIGYFDANCHLIPPLRSQRDRSALRAGLLDGTIDAICSNHTPVDDDAKQLPFAEAEAGATGLELLLPLVLKWAAQENLPLLAAFDKVTHQAAHILGAEGGDITPGAPADLCLFDPQQDWTIHPNELQSQGKNSPFLGHNVLGRVRYTVVGGQVVFAA